MIKRLLALANSLQYQRFESLFHLTAQGGDGLGDRALRARGAASRRLPRGRLGAAALRRRAARGRGLRRPLRLRTGPGGEVGAALGIR